MGSVLIRRGDSVLEACHGHIMHEAGIKNFLAKAFLLEQFKRTEGGTRVAAGKYSATGAISNRDSMLTGDTWCMRAA